MRVLELRARGLTQAEIARKLETSRANVCILERRARANVARAGRTLKLAEKLRAPVVLELKPGDDILAAPERLFKAADAAKVRVKLSTPELIAKIREGTVGRLRGREALKHIELIITANGEVLVY